MGQHVLCAPEPAQDSPLLELVDYINEHMACLAQGTAEPSFSAQSGSLRLRGHELEAQVGPFTLRSVERRVLAPHDGDAVRGYGAHVQVRLPSGRLVAPEILFRLQSSPPAVVAMDRLCRVLHMLQHLERGRDESDLWLHVGLPHVLAVEQGHGEFFEGLLRRCGLGPERIVLILPVVSVSDSAHGRLAEAAVNYRARGYRLALDLREALFEEHRDSASSLGADWWRMHARDAQALGARVVGQNLLLRGTAAATTAASLHAARVLCEVGGATVPKFLL